ncbi:probable peptidyl-tRNA hydrolase [Hypomesus transpacificus]|uniref:probable peptidyl-tRNA hydrolase n=1 Tax=Hypomesus transpacificus TaxID=137520 RepID=UPI001F0838C2|nr:probable peptidyl-tRNA hydrolase [Hypomesus transpacificus]
MRNVTIFSKLWHCVSHFWKLLNFVTMRRLLSKLINRAMLTGAFTPAMGSEAEMHTNVRRRLVVGLGNPGMDGTRHSVGMAVIAALADRLGVADRWRAEKHVSGEVIVLERQDTQIVLLRPRLLMNINGVSVAKAAGKYSIHAEHILLVHDELDKPLGKLAMKLGGSARGHNGVRSCVDCLQTDVMPRLRVGIGRPSGKTSVDRHVLGRFSQEEQKVLMVVLDQSVDLLLRQLTEQEVQSPASPPGGRRTSKASKAGELSTSPAQDSTGAQT